MDPGTRSKTAWEYWVKAVWTECETTEDDEETDRVMEILQGRTLIRLYYIFASFMSLCSGGLDEMSIEGRDRERSDRERLVGPGREWEICGQESWANLREPWLRELYGERVRAR